MPLMAQSGQDYRKYSLNFTAGAVNASNSGSTFSPLGSFGSPLNPGLSIGGGLMYNFTPVFSLEGRGNLHFFNLENPDIVDQVAHTSLRGVFFLNQLVGMPAFSSRLAPYTTAGAGIDIVDVTDLRQSGWNIVAGLGTSIYLSEAIDLFIQYDWSGGNKLNIARSEAETRFSTYRNFYAGLRVNIGTAGTKHPSWQQPLLRREEPTRMMAEERGEAEEEAENAVLISELREQNENLEALLEQLNGQNQLLESEVNILRERISELEMMVDNQEDQPQNPPNEAIYNEVTPGSENAPAVSNETGEADTRTIQPIETDGIYPPRGHYVQLFASYGLSAAARARRMAVAQLAPRFDNAAQMVFVAGRQEFYEVFVGQFSSASMAVDITDVFERDFSDAFVITFPRPQHLSAQYEGMEVITDESEN